MKKVFIFIIIILFLHSPVSGLLASSSMIPEMLCDLGIKFYNQGRYEEAVGEFKKALIVESGYPTALKYIRLIEQIQEERAKKEVIFPSPEAIEKLYGIEKERQVSKERILELTPAVGGTAMVSKGEKISLPSVLVLDETLFELAMPIEIAKDTSLIVSGNNIKRFLVTQPEILNVEKKDTNELLVTGKGIGYTDLLVWDEGGRWDLSFQGIFPKPEGPTYEELMRRKEEEARHFKLHYSLDFSGNEMGRRYHDLKRQGRYSYIHNIGLTGQTPYGNLDSAATLRRLRTTELTYITLGLTDGKVGPFSDFTLRGGDLTPDIANLTLPRTTLRGTLFSSPAFNKKLDYILFWGRESGGRYTLPSDLYKLENSFLSGINLSLTPTKVQNYKFTLVRGWGRDRENFLNEYGYDLLGNWNLDKWGLGYEIAHDSKKIAHLFGADYIAPKLKFSAKLRNVNPDFVSMTGTGWEQGKLGGLFNLNLIPNDKLNISSRLDVYQDRSFPALDNDDRLNEDFDWDLHYRLDPLTDLTLDYFLQNDLGKLSQFRFQSPGLGISRRFKFLRDIYTFFQYHYLENKNFSSPSLDYAADKINLGLRFNLIGELFYYLNKEINWLAEKYNCNRSKPQVFETGLDWSRQLGRLPIYADLRFTYRDEEDAASPLSFLAGQDYIEGYSQLSYRPNENEEIYGNLRVRNSWQDSPNAIKRMDASFNTGVRYLWDTGISWNAICDIEVCVFKDFNSDGLRQRDEPPQEGIKLWLGKDRSEVTDLFGCCKFKGVRGNRAYVSIDLSTLPEGFMLTSPQMQETAIRQNQTVRLYFGVISRSEISGIVFSDKNGNGKYDSNEKGIEGIVITLEDGKKAVTDNQGKYAFTHASAGDHTINVDLNSIPINYLPTTTLTKKITLFEGVTYIYNIPLLEIKEK
jgi:hypothetical protein